MPSIFLQCMVAGHSAGAAYGLATGHEHLECIHAQSKARAHSTEEWRLYPLSHCREGGVEKDSYCAGRQLGAGLGWGSERRTPDRCEMMWPTSVPVLAPHSI